MSDTSRVRVPVHAKLAALRAADLPGLYETQLFAGLDAAARYIAASHLRQLAHDYTADGVPVDVVGDLWERATRLDGVSL